MEQTVYEYESQNPFQPGDLLIHTKGGEGDNRYLFMVVSGPGPTVIKISPNGIYNDFPVYNYIDYTEFEKVGNIKEELRLLAETKKRETLLKKVYENFSIKGAEYESDQRKSKG